MAERLLSNKKMEDTAMMKKKYITPQVDTFALNTTNYLLFGSDVDTVKTEGLSDGDSNDDNVYDDTPGSIWNDAW